MSVQHLFDLFDKRFNGCRIASVFDVGSRDCEQSVEILAKWPDAVVSAFEPNPKTLPQCYAEAMKNWRIRVVPCAVAEANGRVEFHQSVTENNGYSSVYVPSGKYDCVEPMPYNKLTVPSLRLDSYIEASGCIPPQVMWMDCQGSELGALRSLGKHIDTLLGVWTEYWLDEAYRGAPLLQDIDKFFSDAGFERVYRGDLTFGGKPWWGDACYLRK